MDAEIIRAIGEYIVTPLAVVAVVYLVMRW